MIQRLCAIAAITTTALSFAVVGVYALNGMPVELMCSTSPQIPWDISYLANSWAINGFGLTRCVTLNQTSYTIAFWSNITQPPSGLDFTSTPLFKIFAENPSTTLAEMQVIMWPQRLAVQFKATPFLGPWLTVNETNSTGMVGTYNSWHHHAVIYDNSTGIISMFRDGAPIGSGAFSALIGNHCYEIDFTTNGANVGLSSMEVFNRTLSLAELRILFGTGTYNPIGIMTEIMFLEQSGLTSNTQTNDTAYNDGHKWSPFAPPYPLNPNGWYWSGCSNRTTQATQCQQTGCPAGNCVPTPGPSPMCSPFFVNGPCGSAPCANGGTCADGGTSWSCTCAGGFSGQSCQTNINECASFPCQNGGTCFDQTNAFTCACPDGYTGSTCQTQVNECLSTPCQNGGTCTNGVASFSCACAPGYSGRLCQTDINECSSNPCVNAATCVDLPNGFACTCVPGYSGVLCQTTIDECASQPCQNGATCVDALNRFSCRCVQGFVGTLCQATFDSCASFPCQNEGGCVNQPRGQGFRCICPSAWTGTQCQSAFNPCGSAPCSNGGGCINNPDFTYICVCASGFTGTNCQTTINACSSQPCVEGQCSFTSIGFHCTCPPGFTGVLCDTGSAAGSSGSSTDLTTILSSVAGAIVAVVGGAFAIYKKMYPTPTEPLTVQFAAPVPSSAAVVASAGVASSSVASLGHTAASRTAQGVQAIQNTPAAQQQQMAQTAVAAPPDSAPLTVPSSVAAPLKVQIHHWNNER